MHFFLPSHHCVDSLMISNDNTAPRPPLSQSTECTPGVTDSLRKQFLDNMSFDIGQPEVASLKTVVESSVIKAELVQDRGL